MNNNYIIHNGQLYHAGVKGMRWGIRKYQNEDGSLTEAGKKRYGKKPRGVTIQKQRQQAKLFKEYYNATGDKKKELKKQIKEYNNTLVKDFNDYREFTGEKKYSKRDAKSAVESAIIGGKPYRTKYGVEGYYATTIKNMYDPDRGFKNVAKSLGKAAVGWAIIGLGALSSKMLNDFDPRIQLGAKVTTSFIGSTLLGKGIGGLINNSVESGYIKRYATT